MLERKFFFILALAGSAAAGDITGPVSGFLWDPATKVVRPVLGLPGASLMGDGLDFGVELSYAAVAPAQDFVLGTAADGTLRLLRPGVKDGFALQTPHGAPARIVFSPNGSAALLIGSEAVDVYTGLPAKPALARTLSLATRGEVRSWAVSDDGGAVLAASADRVSAAGESAEWAEFAKAGDARVAFAPGSREAAVANAAGLSIYKDVAGGGEAASFAGGDDAPAPDAVAFARDGRVLTASSAGRSVTIWNRSGQRLPVACDCNPGGLSAFGEMFRLTELVDAPLWLFDPNRDEPRVLFVPARQPRP